MLRTNHRNPEKDCLQDEEFRQSLRFTILGAFDADEPVLAAKIKTLAQSVPTLFASILPTDDIQTEDAQDIDDPSVTQQLTQATTSQFSVSVSVRMKPSYCKAELGLPDIESRFPRAFSIKLVQAYRSSYDKNVVLMGGSMLKYWKKLALAPASKSSRRTVLHRGDYISYCRSSNEGFARLDHIFTHESSRGKLFHQHQTYSTEELHRLVALDLTYVPRRFRCALRLPYYHTVV